MILSELDAVAPGDLPVQALADHLRLGSGFSDDGSENAVLEGFLRAALSAIEARTGKAMLRRRFALVLHRWRNGMRQSIPIAPVRAIESVTLIDAAGAATLGDTGLYRLVEDAHRPAIEATGACLPAIADGGQASLVFEAGFGAAWADVPPDLRQATMMLAATYFDHRHGVTSQHEFLPAGVLALLDPYRSVRIGGGGT